MRRVLLWMATNKWMRRNVPRLWIARRAVRRFMPGEKAEDALAAAEKLHQEGFGVLFTHLGENVTRREHHEKAADHYAWMIEETHRRGIDAEASVKLSHLAMDMSTADMQAHMDRLVEKAAEAGNRTVWLDMEGSDHTEGTIAEYERLTEKYPNVGICLQAYLKRTYSDVERLLPLDPRIRLVKGAYDEPSVIAYRRRREVDANFLALCVSILGALKAGRSVVLDLGTHDTRLIEQVAEHARSIGLQKTAFDVAMLYAVRADQQRRLKKEGYTVRVLIAYGENWYPWYVRRLAERPANVVFALRQLLP